MFIFLPFLTHLISTLARQIHINIHNFQSIQRYILRPNLQTKEEDEEVEEEEDNGKKKKNPKY